MPPIRRHPLHAVFDEIDRMGRLTMNQAPTHGASLEGGEDEISDDSEFQELHRHDVSRMQNLVEIEPDLQRAREISKLGTSGGSNPAGSLGAVGAGAANNNIGRSINFVVNENNGLGNAPSDVKEVLRIVGDDSQAEAMTVTLLPLSVVYPDVTSDFQAIAIIGYGVGGVQNVVEIDWLNGLSFQVPGSYVSVSIRIDNSVGTIGTKVTAGAFVSKLSRARKARLTRSIFVGPIAHGVTAPVVTPGGIPACATEIQVVHDNTEAIKDVVVSITSHTGLSYDRQISDNPDPLPFGGCFLTGTIVKIENGDAALDMANVWAVFTIEM